MEEKNLHVRIVPMTADHLDEVAERCERLQAYETKKQKLLAENHDAETLAKILSDNYE